jgi:hypothetical protein
MTDATAQIRLIACYDLRTIDPITGEKEPLAEGQGCTCDRCGKVHAVVYQVAEFGATKEGLRYPIEGTMKQVGSTCFKKMFNQTPAVMGRTCYVREYSGEKARTMLASARGC